MITGALQVFFLLSLFSSTFKLGSVESIPWLGFYFIFTISIAFFHWIVPKMYSTLAMVRLLFMQGNARVFVKLVCVKPLAFLVLLGLGL